MRSAGVRLHYPELNPLPEGVKTGILLEAGFDQVAPNRACLISSWAYDRAAESGLEDLTDNRAIDVPYYEPGYTLVEKLQTISTKYRHQQATGAMPQNFLRHYYDVYCLLDDPGVHRPCCEVAPAASAIRARLRTEAIRGSQTCVTKMRAVPECERSNRTRKNGCGDFAMRSALESLIFQERRPVVVAFTWTSADVGAPCRSMPC